MKIHQFVSANLRVGQHTQQHTKALQKTSPIKHAILKSVKDLQMTLRLWRLPNKLKMAFSEKKQNNNSKKSKK